MRLRGGSLTAQELGVQPDRGDQVVELVRDAAGQPAHGLHLLRKAQLLLEPNPLVHLMLESLVRVGKLFGAFFYPLLQLHAQGQHAPVAFLQLLAQVPDPGL